MYLEVCTDEQLLSFYAEFGATPELIEKNVQHLIAWMGEQSHLPTITDKNWLENVLLRCKNQLKRAETFLDQYYTCRAEEISIFTHRDPYAEELQNCYKIICLVPMAKLTPEGYRVLCYKIFEHKTEDLPDPEVLLRSYQIISDVLLKEDRHKGIIVIANLENVSYKLFTMLLSMLRPSLVMATKINRVRLHAVHIVNVTSVLEMLLTLTKCFLKKELNDRFQVWNKSLTDFAEILPKECLPKEYGGDEKSLEECRDLWCDYQKNFREWLISEESVKADLSKKPKKSYFGNLFGRKK